MNCNKINSVLIYNSKNISLKKSNEKKEKNAEYLQNKRLFIDSETKSLTNLSLITLFFSIPFFGFKAGLEKKMTTKEKFGAGLILLSLAFSLIADFKSISLSKQYDKERKL